MKKFLKFQTKAFYLDLKSSILPSAWKETVASSDTKMRVMGYPGEKTFPMAYEHTGPGRARSHKSGQGNMLHYNIQTTRGQSGSPVQLLDNNGRLIG